MALTPYGMPTDAQMSMEGDLQKYVDAYDFAPVGFVTLDAQGRILQTNLAGAILLDIQRSQCQHHDFSDFLADESQAVFARFHQEVLGGQCRRHCVVHLTATAHRSALQVRIDATVDEWGVENRMVLIDVSEQVTNTALQGTHWPFQRAEAGIPYTSWPS
jgi:PAS domain-containing protein